MYSDPVVEEIREVRHKISKACNHDPKKLIEYLKSEEKNYNGIKIDRVLPKKEIPDRVEKSLKAVGLWQDLKDRLKDSAMLLSQEQQQRLCIARLAAVESEIKKLKKAIF